MSRWTRFLFALVLVSQSAALPQALAQSHHHHRGHGGNNSWLGALALGIFAGVGIAALLSQRDQRAMDRAYEDALGDDIGEGEEIPWVGDGHRGHFVVESRGHYIDRRDIPCRRVRMVVTDRYGRPVPDFERQPPRVVCYSQRSSRWEPLENPRQFVMIRRPAPPPAIYVQPRIAVPPPPPPVLPLPPGAGPYRFAPPVSPYGTR